MSDVLTRDFKYDFGLGLNIDDSAHPEIQTSMRVAWERLCASYTDHTIDPDGVYVYTLPPDFDKDKQRGFNIARSIMETFFNELELAAKQNDKTAIVDQARLELRSMKGSDEVSYWLVLSEAGT